MASPSSKAISTAFSQCCRNCLVASLRVCSHSILHRYVCVVATCLSVALLFCVDCQGIILHSSRISATKSGDWGGMMEANQLVKVDWRPHSRMNLKQNVAVPSTWVAGYSHCDACCRFSRLYSTHRPCSLLCCFLPTTSSRFSCATVSSSSGGRTSVGLLANLTYTPSNPLGTSGPPTPQSPFSGLPQPCTYNPSSDLAPVREDIREQRVAFKSSADKLTDPSYYKDGSLLLACKRLPTKRVPVWLMRQAGRYLPEFREIRARHAFLEVCSDPELASEVTIQPLRRYKDLSAGIIFSDILVIPKAMGQGVRMVSGVGPVMDWKLEHPSDVDTKLNLSPNVDATLGYVFDAIYLTQQKLEKAVPLIGFCGAPLTLMCYMVEGRGSQQWPDTKKWLYTYPAASRKLLDALAQIAAQYLVKQYDAGAPVLQVFDTHAGILPPEMYEEFGAKPMMKIAEMVKQKRPKALLIGFPKDRAGPTFKNSAFDVIALGWGENPKEMRKCFGDKKTLQGNLDPAVLYGSPDLIRREAQKMVKRFGTLGYIANLGHGLEPSMDPSSVTEFIKAVQDVTVSPANKSPG